MSNKNDEIVIIGASIAGSFLGYLLKLNGFKYTILDGSPPPREKACGEGLSTIGKRYLEASGLWDGYLEKDAFSYLSYDITFEDKSHTELSSAKTIGYSIQRSIIDSTLCKAAGCDFEHKSSEKVTSISKANDRWTVKTANTEYNAKYVVLACGKPGRSLIESGILQNRTTKARYGLSFRCDGKWNNLPPKKVFIKNTGPYQILLTPLSDTKINLSILVSRNNGTDLKEGKDVLVEESIEFAKGLGFSISNYEECRGSSDISSSKCLASPENLYLIGDSAEIFDAIGGMGMSHALFSASLAAEHIMQSIDAPERAAKFHQKYINRREFYSKIFRLLTSLSFKMNAQKNPVLRKLALYFPSISRFLNSSLANLFPIVGAASDIHAIKKTEHSILIKQNIMDQQ